MQEISSRQNNTWIIAAMTAPVLHLAGGIAWPQVLIVSALAAAGRRIFRKTESLWIRSAVFGGAAAEALALLSPCWPEQKDMGWVLGILLLLAALSVIKGRQTTIDGGILLWWITAFLIGSVLFSALSQGRIRNLIPGALKIQVRKDAQLLGVLLLPAFLGNPERKELPERYLFLFPVIAAVTVQSILNIESAGTLGAPFYEMSRSIRLYGVFDRMEGLTWMGMMLGSFLYLTMILTGVIQAGETGRNRKKCLLFLSIVMAEMGAVLLGEEKTGFLAAFMILAGFTDSLWRKRKMKKYGENS